MSSHRTSTLLYIEDDPASKKLMQQFVQSYQGMEYLTAWSGEEGLALAGKHKPGLVFLDIMLPCMNGREVIQQLRALEDMADVPVYAISADAIPEHIEKTLACGFNGYITKPVNLQVVGEIIEKELLRG